MYASEGKHALAVERKHQRPTNSHPFRIRGKNVSRKCVSLQTMRLMLELTLWLMMIGSLHLKQRNVQVAVQPDSKPV